MAFIGTPNAAKAVISFSTGSQEWGLTLWFTKLNFTTSDMQDLADHLSTNLVTGLLQQMTNVTTYVRTTVYDMRTVTGEKLIDTPAIPPAGAQASNPVSMAVAAVITFGTAARGKTSQGRNYVGGMNEDAAGRANIGSGTLDALVGSYTNHLLQSQINGWEWVVVSFQENNQPRTEGLARPVTSVYWRNDTQGIQRRRLRKS